MITGLPTSRWAPTAAARRPVIDSELRLLLANRRMVREKGAGKLNTQAHQGYFVSRYFVTGRVGAGAESIACHPLSIRKADNSSLAVGRCMSGTLVRRAAAWEPAIACQRERLPR